MGKPKQTQRTKGNLQPSSSAKAAELVVKSGGVLPGQFFVLSKFLKSQGEEADASVPDDSDFCYVLKKLSKKDSNTRKKGLQEFGQLSLEKDLEVVSAILPYWIPHYIKLSLDNDRNVRELCQECFSKLSERLKNKLAPHLKEIMGTWLMAQCDCHQQSALLAKKAFETLFREAKQAEAVWFCKTEILKLLTNILFETTKENIKASEVCEAEEVEDRLMRLQTSSLDALSKFIKLADLQYDGSQVTESIETILSNQNFWKFHKSPMPSVRRAFFDLAANLCDRGTFGGESTYKSQVCRSVLLCIDESNPHVIPALWKAVVSVCDVQDCWSHVSLNKAFLPKLFNALDDGCHGCSEVTHPNLVIIVDKLPLEVKTDNKFVSRFLGRVRNSLNQNAVLMSYRECDAITKSFVECLKYFIFNFCENKSTNVDIAFIVTQIMDLFKFILTSDKNSLSCTLKHVSDLVWYLNKMCKISSTDEGESNDRLEIWKQVFEATLDEFLQVSVDIFNNGMTERPVVNLFAFYRLFLTSSSDQGNVRTIRRFVRFSKHKLISVEKIKAQIGNEELKVRSSDDIMEAYRTNRVLKEFIHRLSFHFYSAIALPRGSIWTVKLFRMLFERFACDDFLLALKPSDVEDSNRLLPNRRFAEEVVLPWLISADATSLPEVVKVFVKALTMESDEGERTKCFELVMTKLESDDGNVKGKKKKLYECLSLLFESSGGRLLVRFLETSEKCRSIVMSTVVHCVNDFMKNEANEEAWSVLCSSLTIKEGADSSIKCQIMNSLKSQLQASMLQGFISETFDFIQIFCSQLLRENSIVKLKTCDAFQFYMEMLFWASVKAMPEISNEVCREARKTLVLTLEVMMDSSDDEKKFEESKFGQKMLKLLLSYVTNLVRDYNQLKEVIDTSVAIVGLFQKSFEDFSFFSGFLCNPTESMVRAKESAGTESVEIETVERLFQQNNLSLVPLSVESHIYLQTFYAKLLYVLVTSRKIVSQNAKHVEDALETDDSNAMFKQGMRNLVKVAECQTLTFLNHLIDGSAILAYCDLKCCDDVSKDFTIAIVSLIRLLDENVAWNLLETRIDLCLDSKTDHELDVNTLAIYNLLKQVTSVECLWNSLTSDELPIIGKLLEGADVSCNKTKVLMAMICILPEKSVKKIFDKFLEVIKNSDIESEDDLSESLLNTFDIVNTILTSRDFVKFSADGDSSAELSQESKSEDLKSSELLFAKINEVKQFCEGMFENGTFDKRIAKFNMTVINFYKNVVSKFANCPRLAEERWDEVLCFVVSRFQGMNDLSELPRHFECFLESILPLILEMSKIFNSKEFKENSARLSDEWLNVFQPTIYEHLNPFFSNVVTDEKFKGLQLVDSLELLCDVILHCPPESFHHFLAPSSSSPLPYESGDEAESLFEFLLPVMDRCHLLLPGFGLLKKLVPKKAEQLFNKFAEENADDESDENQRPLGPATFLPSLMEAFENHFKKLEAIFPETSKLFEEVSLTASNRSEILSYLLTFELILDVFKRSPAVARISLSRWFSDVCIDRHMSVLTSITTKTPSIDLQLASKEDSLPNSDSHVGVPADRKSFFNSLGCEDTKYGRATRRRKLQSQDEEALRDLDQFAFRILFKTVHAFPRVVRNWYLGLDQKGSLQIDKFVMKFVSPGYILKEINEALRATSEQTGLNFQVRRQATSLVAAYSAEDATIGLTINFPDNSPLSHVRVTFDDGRIHFVKQLSLTWKLQLNKLLNYKDASVTEALMMLSKSLDRRFDGNSCMICFSLVLSQQGVKVLPKMQCKTCKKKFHNACLLKWFESSHNAACPLCRSTF